MVNRKRTVSSVGSESAEPDAPGKGDAGIARVWRVGLRFNRRYISSKQRLLFPLSLQFTNEPFEIVPLAQRVEILVLLKLVQVLVARGHGFLEPRHGRVRLLAGKPRRVRGAGLWIRLDDGGRDRSHCRGGVQAFDVVAAELFPHLGRGPATRSVLDLLEMPQAIVHVPWDQTRIDFLAGSERDEFVDQRNRFRPAIEFD